MGHILKIICLHDAQAECSCGWSITCTEERAKAYIVKEHERHKAIQAEDEEDSEGQQMVDREIASY